MTIYQIVCRHLRANGACSFDSCLIEVLSQTSLDKVRATNGLSDALEMGRIHKTIRQEDGTIEPIYPAIQDVYIG